MSPLTKPGFADFYKQNVGLARKVAFKVHHRLLAMGAAVEFCDVEQEATIAMMAAYEKFNPELGFKFSTYYYRAAYNKLNAFACSYEKDRTVLGVTSISRLDDDGESFELELFSDSGSPEQILEARQTLDEIERELTPLAGKLLEILIEPPRALENEWEAARSLGVERTQEMTLSFAGRYLRVITGASGREIDAACREVRALRGRLNAG